MISMGFPSITTGGAAVRRAGRAGAYLALMPATNPQSPLNVYPRAALVTTSVTAGYPAGAQHRGCIS